MASFKPEMSSATAKTFIQNLLKRPVYDVQAIEVGELSKVFSYNDQGKGYVIHFNSIGDGFEKVQYVYKNFSSQGLPIPNISEIGHVGDLNFSISEKAPGQVLVGLSESEIKQVLPDLVKKFTKITGVQVDQSKGYGWIGSTGDGSYSSWTAFIDSFFQEEQTGFWHNWHELFKTSFLEQDVFERLYTIMIDLAERSPQETYLVHGDFHLGNMLTDGSNITAIVDWEMALYGDFSLI